MHVFDSVSVIRFRLVSVMLFARYGRSFDSMKRYAYMMGHIFWRKHALWQLASIMGAAISKSSGCFLRLRSIEPIGVGDVKCEDGLQCVRRVPTKAKRRCEL